MHYHYKPDPRRNGRTPKTTKGSLKKIKYCKITKGEHDFVETKRYTSFHWIDEKGRSVSSGKKPENISVHHTESLVIIRCSHCRKKDYLVLTEG